MVIEPTLVKDLLR